MPQKIFYKTFSSPIGRIKIITSEKKIIKIELPSIGVKSSKFTPKILKLTEKQIKEYFAGKRNDFGLSILIEKLEGTPFQRRIWKAMSKIPYARTIPYGELAKTAGSPRAYRAVGSACGKNPLPIIIPCHRVVASGGKLGGFSSGLWRKKWLLNHERNCRGERT